MNKEKLAAELIAQRKRVEAIAYLDKQGQSVDAKHAAAKAAAKPVDNTLELLQKKRLTTYCANSISSSHALKTTLLQQQDEVRQTNTILNEQLPVDWTKVLDESSKLYYYWNNKTNETTWEKPRAQQQHLKGQKLPMGWRTEIHSATKQIYYVNDSTGEKCFEIPSAKSAVAKIPTSEPSIVPINNNTNGKLTASQQREKRQRIIVDPLDFTGGMSNKHMRGGDVDKMADSTASGPLWQQRPYPAPSAALSANNNNNNRNGKSHKDTGGAAIGPSLA